MDTTMMKNGIPFGQNAIRKAWYKEEWYFSVVDIMAVLTDQSDHQIARKYWNKLAERLRNEGSEVVTNCHRLKMIAQDGKMRTVAKHARKELESKTGKSVISGENFLPPHTLRRKLSKGN